ncbi:hypothetical protein [Paenibacillus sp. FSL L8-0708]|uniref:hypothetical protein n=1 Tax=Paenibacillus sp. FSL L8-0708 TaxID=2975311 RepID=UPI0030FBD348
MGINALKAAKDLRGIVEAVKTTYEQSVKDEIYHSEECTDIVHALELLKLTPRQRLNLSEQLGVSRWKRRKAKEDKELLQPLAEYLKRQKGMAGELDKVILAISDLTKTQTMRVYRPKVRTDLGSIFEHRARERTAAAVGNIRRDRRVRCGINL